MARSGNSQPRQATSGMIVTIIPIGIVMSMEASSHYRRHNDWTVPDAVEIKRLNIQNTGTISYITGMIKNSGNTDISNAIVIVTLDIGDDTIDEDGLFIAAFGPANIHSRVTATVNEKILVGDTEDRSADQTASAENDDYHRLTIGQKYRIKVRADIAGGGTYSQTKTISPTIACDTPAFFFFLTTGQPPQYANPIWSEDPTNGRIRIQPVQIDWIAVQC